MFKLQDLFASANGDFDIQKYHLNGMGTVVVSAGESSNGIIGCTNIPARIFSPDTITIDMFGNAYYQPFPYKIVTHARVFSLSPVNGMEMNKEIGLYTIAHFRYFKHLFSYDNMCSWEKIRHLVMPMPLTAKGTIDFEYIEDCIRELEDERIREVEAYLQEAGFEDCNLTENEHKALSRISNIPMREYSLGELFDIRKGKRLTKEDMIPGSINFIGATAENNGLTNKIANGSHLHSSNTITVTYNGSVGVAFYQFERFWASDDVNVLYSREPLDEDLALYYLAPIRKKGKGYAYSFKWTKEKMESDTIWLPCRRENGKLQIDYDFMSTYITAIRKQCIALLKEEIGRERNAYGKITNTVGKKYPEVEYEPLMAAESFERYKWEWFGQSIIDFFGNNQTILVGCYKDKKYHEWILANHLYNIRLGNTKGSMDSSQGLFGRASLLVLYELGKPYKLCAYKITGHQEISKDELLRLDYPNHKPRKRYMAFYIEPLEMDLTFLAEHHLIERLIELNVNNAKGTPVFIEP